MILKLQAHETPNTVPCAEQVIYQMLVSIFKELSA